MTRSNSLRAFVVMAAGAIGALVASACNGILGNDGLMLEGLPEGSTREAGKNDADVGPSEGGACNADLTRDPKNCGACGHDCLAGACTAGACQPFGLATGLTNPTRIVISDGHLYWLNGDGTVRGCDAASCATTMKVITTLVTGNPVLSGLAVQGQTLYFVGYYTQSLYSCPVTGCASPTTLANNIPDPHSVVVDAVNAYVLSASQAYLVRCPLPSCAGGPVKIAADGKPAWYGTVLDDTTVYWYGGGPTGQFDRSIVYRAPKTQVDGGAEILLANRTVQGSTNIAVRNGTMFVAEDSAKNDAGATKTGTVFKMSLGAGLIPFPLADGQPPMGGIVADDTHVYWVDSSVGAIKRCEIAGCNRTPTVLVTGQNVVTRPVLTPTAIYWTEYLGGTVKGLAK